MTHLKAFSILLGIFIFTTGCATAPEVGDSQLPGDPGSGANPGGQERPADDPIAYFPAPPQAPLTVSLPRPNPFRFDASKKVALQKEKLRLGVRRAPMGSLSPVVARSRLAPPLSGDDLPNPTPPPASPEVEPILPEAEVVPPTTDGASPIEWRIESNSRAGERPGRGFGSVTGRGPRNEEPSGSQAPAEPDSSFRRVAGGQRAAEPRSPAAESARPVEAGEPQPGTARDPQPEAVEEPQPGTARDPQPGTAREPQPGTARDPQPEAVEEQRPGLAARESRRSSPGSESETPSAARSIRERSRYPYESLDSSSETIAAVGEEMTVSLPGEGWLFLGEASHAEPVRFLSQNESDRETRFRFRITEPGAYELLFQRQDLMAGTLAEHLLSVEAKSGDQPGRPAPIEGVTRITAAEIGLSFPEAPGSEGNESGDNATSPQDGGQAAADGDSPTSTGTTRAPATGSQEQQNQEPKWPEEIATTELLADLRATLARADESPEESVLSLSQLLVQRRNPEGALLLLEEYQRRGETEVGLDEVWFEMAQLLERREEVRDLRRAVGLYERLVDEYPLSVYYRDARQRAEYLQRHFFLVR